MKMNDFLTKDTTYKAKQAPVFNLNNELKETQLEVKIKELESKLGVLEAIRVEKGSVDRQLETQTKLTTTHYETAQDLTKQVSDLTMELHDKQRVLELSDGLKQETIGLATENGEAVHTLANLRMDITKKDQELGMLRNNAFNLESKQRSMMNAAQQKDTLLRELTEALGELKEQHDGLTSSSNALAKQYADVSEAIDKLDTIN